LITKNELEFYKLKAEFCKTLADPKRLMIIDYLRSGEKSVGELAEYTKSAQSVTSRHLAILRERGVIQPRRDGNTIFYSLTDNKIGQACDLVKEMLLSKIAKHSEFARQLIK
jgi:DNA-binding transcriptional ArsR family regulator